MQEREIKKIEYDNDWPIVAICYDFDKTLSPKDMQNFSLIPKLKCKINPFWKEAGALAKKNGMDKIIAYMKLIVDKAKAVKEKITRSDFNELGKTIELFNGVDSWFDRINDILSSFQKTQYLLLPVLESGNSHLCHFLILQAKIFCR